MEKHNDQVWWVNRATDHHERLVKTYSKFRAVRNNHIIRLVLLIASGTFIVLAVGSVTFGIVLTIGMIAIVAFENWKYMQSKNKELLSRTKKRLKSAEEEVAREKEKLAMIRLEDN